MLDASKISTYMCIFWSATSVFEGTAHTLKCFHLFWLLRLVLGGAILELCVVIKLNKPIRMIKVQHFQTILATVPQNFFCLYEAFSGYDGHQLKVQVKSRTKSLSSLTSLSSCDCLLRAAVVCLMSIFQIVFFSFSLACLGAASVILIFANFIEYTW